MKAFGTHARPNTHALANSGEDGRISKIDKGRRCQRELAIIQGELNKRGGKIDWAKIDNAYLEMDRKEDFFLLLETAETRNVAGLMDIRKYIYLKYYHEEAKARAKKRGDAVGEKDKRFLVIWRHRREGRREEVGVKHSVFRPTLQDAIDITQQGD